ncbi:acyclic terpene utilization AtuA family protein [Roseovarius sp. MMSF_3281]|uniref:acyclic terpene utilization AtuA family protein n=1 Tax=Roseovarius sp. MMSF_3281 TaxID=3046694 RepID=UPI00273D984F|nr:acyclic terpene utilization AtuA family protein [Roseovarius sp. MMSF_3281]
MTRPLLIGSGAGFSGDRVDAGLPVVREIARQGGGVIIYETIGERTLALGQSAYQRDPSTGYEPLLEQYLEPVLAEALAGGVAIVGNFGCANPVAAARSIGALVDRLGLSRPRIAVVEGDDILPDFDPQAALSWEQDDALPLPPGGLLSANAYTGAQGIADALRSGAQIVVTGRVADPALALGPLVAHHGWDWMDHDLIAAGTLAGHLLECGSQVSGGYFADPGCKNVPGMAEIGFPIGSIATDGTLDLFKPPATGGCITRATVSEQLLYEVHDPTAYVTPDVVLDLTGVRLEEIGVDRVRVTGARGHPPPSHLKVTVGYEGHWFGEAEISYAGPGCTGRARLAAETLEQRLCMRALPLLGRRVDIVGINSSFGDDAGNYMRGHPDPVVPEVRVRLAVRTETRESADAAMQELLALYCCGPAGGGGVRTHVARRVETRSCLYPRHLVEERVSFVGPEGLGVCS